METVMLAEGVAEEGLKPFYKPMIPNSAFTPSKSGAERDELLISVEMVLVTISDTESVLQCNLVQRCWEIGLL
jgi:hypothetical protein